MAKRKTRSARKNDYAGFFAKAREFMDTMEQALAASQWDSVGLQAVHTVISASDAVAVYYGGVRSAEPDHRAVVGLLEDILGSDIAAASRHVSNVIAKKNTVEYEQRRLTAKEARDMAEHARRFVEWAEGMLPAR